MFNNCHSRRDKVTNTCLPIGREFTKTIRVDSIASLQNNIRNNMSWNSFKDLADKAVDKKGIKYQIQESLVLESANRVLVDFLSDKAKDKMSAIYFKSGILTIAALDDNLLKHLLNDKDLFIASLNNKLRDNIIEDLNFLS